MIASYLVMCTFCSDCSMGKLLISKVSAVLSGNELAQEQDPPIYKPQPTTVTDRNVTVSP